MGNHVGKKPPKGFAKSAKKGLAMMAEEKKRKAKAKAKNKKRSKK